MAFPTFHVVFVVCPVRYYVANGHEKCVLRLPVGRYCSTERHTPYPSQECRDCRPVRFLSQLVSTGPYHRIQECRIGLQLERVVLPAIRSGRSEYGVEANR